MLELTERRRVAEPPARRPTPIAAALIALATLGTVPARAAGGPGHDPSPRIEAFGREIEGLRHLLGIPGLQVAVVQGDRVICERGIGHADLKAGEPMTTDHLIEIASVTKTMTAVVMMQLVAEGKVSLDDRVDRKSTRLNSSH